MGNKDSIRRKPKNLVVTKIIARSLKRSSVLFILAAILAPAFCAIDIPRFDINKHKALDEPKISVGPYSEVIAENADQVEIEANSTLQLVCVGNSKIEWIFPYYNPVRTVSALFLGHLTILITKNCSLIEFLLIHYSFFWNFYFILLFLFKF